LVAGVLFVLPGLLAIMALSIVYALYGDVGPVSALFFGLKAAVLVIVLEAVIRVGKRALKNGVMLAIAAAAFVGIFVFDAPFPLIVVAAGLIGFAGGLARNPAFLVGGGHGPATGEIVEDADTVLGEETPAHARPDLGWSLRIGSALLALWLGPVLTLGLALGWDNVFSEIAVFFSKMAVVTFGGAYAVLAYVAQEAVETFGWLRPGEMLDGLGMAETTPGPLIMVTQFVGFLAAFREATGLSPLIAGVLGGLLTTWVTFVPCFLWIFLGAPWIEALRGAKVLSAALAAITAAVVGVILNLAIWFALHVLFRQVREITAGPVSVDAPVPASIDPVTLLLALAAAIAVFRFKVGVIKVLLACAVAGLAWYAIRLA
ncbi:MAG TPA: chromate transporter, partial [Caulobacteraceae bacterium]